MPDYKINCEVVKISTGEELCPGLAKMELGEISVIGVRTPEGKGICSTALTAIQPWAHSMRLTEKMGWEKQDHFDITCPHGKTTFRLSRIREEAKNVL